MWYALTYHMIHTKCYIMWYASNHGVNVFTHTWLLGGQCCWYSVYPQVDIFLMGMSPPHLSINPSMYSSMPTVCTSTINNTQLYCLAWVILWPLIRSSQGSSTKKCITCWVFYPGSSLDINGAVCVVKSILGIFGKLYFKWTSFITTTKFEWSASIAK